MALTRRRLQHTKNTEVWEVRDDTRTRYIKLVFDADLDAVTAFAADHKDPWVSTGERYDSFEEARSANGLPKLDDTAPRLTLTPKARARWVWLTGMMVVSPTLGRYRLTEANQTRPTSECEPDLTDEVTAACLPMVVRKAWGCVLYAVPFSGGSEWGIIQAKDNGNIIGFAPTEAEAWVKALEAAP